MFNGLTTLKRKTCLLGLLLVLAGPARLAEASISHQISNRSLQSDDVALEGVPYPGVLAGGIGITRTASSGEANRYATVHTDFVRSLYLGDKPLAAYAMTGLSQLIDPTLASHNAPDAEIAVPNPAADQPDIATHRELLITAPDPVSVAGAPTIIAAALLVLPFGLCTLRILQRGER